MTSLSQDIRGVLQVCAGANAVGFPPEAQRAYEGRSFQPTIGTPWARFTLNFTSSASPYLSNEKKTHTGLFLIEVATPNEATSEAPSGPGTAAIDILADAVKSAFPAGLILRLAGGEKLKVRDAIRTGVLEEQDWLRVVVTVRWRCESSRD